MAARAEWYEKGRVMYFQLLDKTTREDLEELVKAGKQAAIDYPDSPFIHSITDLSQAELAVGLQDIRVVFAGEGHLGSRGWSVVVGVTNRMTQFLVGTIGQLFNFRIRVFSTLEEGLEFLNDVDDTLPPLLPIKADFREHLILSDDNPQE